MRESASLAMTLSNVWRAGPAPIILCRELNRELCRNPRGRINKVHDKARDEGNRSGIRHPPSLFELWRTGPASGINLFNHRPLPQTTVSSHGPNKFDTNLQL